MAPASLPGPDLQARWEADGNNLDASGLQNPVFPQPWGQCSPYTHRSPHHLPLSWASGPKIPASASLPVCQNMTTHLERTTFIVVEAPAVCCDLGGVRTGPQGSFRPERSQAGLGTAVWSGLRGRCHLVARQRGHSEQALGGAAAGRWATPPQGSASPARCRGPPVPLVLSWHGGVIMPLSWGSQRGPMCPLKTEVPVVQNSWPRISPWARLCCVWVGEGTPCYLPAFPGRLAKWARRPAYSRWDCVKGAG
jgi:hypothetical protein